MSNCLECGKRITNQPLFVLENAPASAQDIPDADQLSKDKGIAMALFRCPCCGLVQFDCRPVSYYRDVIRAVGLTSTMVNLRREQYKHLIDTYHLEGRRFIEIGCGGGDFLKVLSEYPVEVYGIEHNQTLVNKARDAGLNVWQDFPESDDASIDGAPYDVFLSFNFLEHQPHPSTMLRAIYNNLADDGYGLITVPALEYIAGRGTYYELIHDHLAYYSKNTLRLLLEMNGFEVLEQETVNRDTLSVIVRKVPDFDFEGAVDSLTDASLCQADDSDAGLAKSLTDGYHKLENDIQAFLVLLQVSNMSLALWGAGHQGFTLASTTMLGGFADYMIDSAPFKQWRYAPASHLRIVPPEYFAEHPTDAILITAPGYTEEIASQIRESFGDDVNIFAIRSDAIEDLS